MSLKGRKPGVIATVAVAVLGMLAAVPGPARATFPGRPGLLVFNLTFHGEDHSVFTGGLYAIRPGQKHPHQLTRNPLDYEPSFAPSGKKLVFRRIAPSGSENSTTGLYAFDLSSGMTTRLTSGQSDTEPSFGPHSAIAFSRFVAGHSYDLFLRTSTGRQRQLTSSIATDEDPIFSPDGKRIIFTQARRHFVALGLRERKPTSEKLLSIRTDGTGLREIPTVAGASNFDISPDGSHVVFELPGQETQEVPTSEVWTKRLAGVSPTLVSKDANYPAYSPTGDTIAYSNYSGLWARSADRQGRSTLVLKAIYLPLEAEGELLIDPAWQPLP